VLFAGALGNLITAAVLPGHHVSVGASTAIFGALGGLLGVRVIAARQVVSAHPLWTAVAATGALFGMLGTAPGADVPAHFFGLLCGALLGVAWIVGGARLPSRLVQYALTVAAAGVVALCWTLAFGRGSPVV